MKYHSEHNFFSYQSGMYNCTFFQHIFLSRQNNFKARIYEINAFWISVSCLAWFVLKKEKLSAWWDAFLVFEIKVYLRIWDLSFWQFLIWRQLSRSLRLLDWFFLSLLCLSVFPTFYFLGNEHSSCFTTLQI